MISSGISFISIIAKWRILFIYLILMIILSLLFSSWWIFYPCHPQIIGMEIASGWRKCNLFKDSSFINCMTTDQSGNIYIAGQVCCSADFDPGWGIIMHTTQGRSDAFLCNYRNDLSYLNSTTFGGSGRDSIMELESSNDVVYIAGNTDGSIDFNNDGIMDIRYNEQHYSNFIASFNKEDLRYNWNYNWSIRSIDSFHISDIIQDNAGNIIATGWFKGDIDFDNDDNIDFNGSNIFKSYIIKLSKEGNTVWFKILNANNDVFAVSVSVDSNDNYAIASLKTKFTDEGHNENIQIECNDGHRINRGLYIIKYDSSGNILFSNDLEYEYYDIFMGLDIEHDQMDNLYVAGTYFGGIDFSEENGTLFTSDKGSNVFLCKYDKNNNLIWTIDWGGNQNIVATGINIDTNNNVYVLGRFNGEIDFDPNPEIEEIELSNMSNDRSFIVEVNSNGEFRQVWTGLGWGSDYGDDNFSTIILNTDDIIIYGRTAIYNYIAKIIK